MDSRHTDSELVAAARAGDRQAFGELVERYKTLVFSIAHALAGGAGEREDIAQESFLTAWQHLSELRKPERFRVWLCRITRSVHRELRRNKRSFLFRYGGALAIEPGIANAQPSPLEAAISGEEERLLRSALGSIPEAYRIALVLYYFEDRNIDEVARALGLRVTTTTKRISDARGRLRERVAAIEEILQKCGPRREFTAGVLAALSALSVDVRRAEARSTHAQPALGISSRPTVLLVSAALVLVATGVGAGLQAASIARARRPSAVAPAGETLRGLGPNLPLSPTIEGAALVGPREVGLLQTDEARVLASFDFESGVMDEVFEAGFLTNEGCRPGSGSCAQGELLPKVPGRTYLLLTQCERNKCRVLYDWSSLGVLSFDYWMGERTGSAAKPLLVQINLGRESGINFRFSIADPVRGRWAHADLRLADFIPDTPDSATKLEPGYGIRGVLFGGDLSGIYIDDVRLVDLKPGAFPAASSHQNAQPPRFEPTAP